MVSEKPEKNQKKAGKIPVVFSFPDVNCPWSVIPEE